MTRVARVLAVVPLVLLMLAAPAAAAQDSAADRTEGVDADHIGGAFAACGRVIFFEAPAVGMDGLITIAGTALPSPVEPIGSDHTWTIDEAAAVDPRIGPLAAVGAWTCLDIVADGMALISSLTVPAGHTSCGVLSHSGGTNFQFPNAAHELMTIVLDGEAGALVAADPDLAAIVAALVAVWDHAAEACLDFTFALDGSLSGLTLDYAQTPGGDLASPIACGAVGGTPIPYRDPASQPFPDGTTVTVDGFSVDATLVDAPHQSVLSFHLDAGLDLCLLARVVDNVIVEVAVFTGVTNAAEVCGALEVIGGLVFVDTVVIPQGLTGLNFAEPTPAEIASACAGATGQEAAAAGHFAMCGTFEAVTDMTFTVSGITFHLETSIDDDNAPAVGGPRGILLQGPIDPYAPFGPANPATLTATPLAGCAGAPVPDTSMVLAGGMPTPLLALLAVVLMGGGIGLAVVRGRRS